MFARPALLQKLFRRANMSTRAMTPAEPLIVVLGSTGTGKSELAVELATRFKGEIINTDAMQLYKGLPIITNKITSEERKGIPHHLLDHISLDQTPWVVDDFKCAALKTIREIRDRGNLPIVVGGTHYYINALLFEDIFVASEKETPDSAFPILSESTEVLLAKLKSVDPVMAAKWHPNDRRKISRSLKIFLEHGRPASEIYAEQKQRRGVVGSSSQLQESGVGSGNSSNSWENILFWVHSDPEVLKKRLDNRVDKMLCSGLMQEVSEMFKHVKQKETEGNPIDFTKGVWQSIGFKEFEPYLRAVHDEKYLVSDSEDKQKLLITSLEAMKSSTRQYAKYQTRWIRTKLVPLLQEQPATTAAMEKFFVLDSTDVSQWADNVAEPAASVTAKFLEGFPTPNPTSLSTTAREVLQGVTAQQAQRTPCQRTCEQCHVTCINEEDWKKHVQSRKHRTALNRKKKRALVPVETA